MTEFVAGFLFNRPLTNVVLIKKNRPAWMAGLYNAVGGHIEEGESPEQAMEREFYEEAGVLISEWHKFATLNTRAGVIHWFWTTGKTSTLYAVNTRTDEEIYFHEVGSVLLGDTTPKCMVNLNWLIGMALNGARGLDTCEAFEITENIYRDEVAKETT